ncbi:MAG: HAMP domain-containing protein [Firmicutes bacterium]|nr:HAMP domain-containing protein [Bacillota bacterium]
MKMRMSMRGKLLATFGVIIGLTLAGNLYTFHLLKRWDAAHMAAIAEEQFGVFVAEREVDHLAWDVDLLTALLLGEQFEGELDPTACKLGQWHYSYTSTEDFEGLSPEMRAKITALETPHSQLHEQARRLLSLRDENLPSAALVRDYRASVEPNLNQVRQIMAELRQDAKVEGLAAIDLAEAIEVQTIKVFWLVIIATVIISIALVAVLSGGIHSTLQAVVAMAKDIARGDLSGSLSIKTGDELETMADTVNQFVDHVRDIVNGVRASVISLNGTSHQVARAMDEMSASTQEVAATASQFAAHVQQVSLDANEMAKNADRIAGSGREGSDRLDEVLRRMAEIELVVGKLAESVKELNHETGQIESITATITDIADQINLLALNAAIEAARAGEQGRGFAVVAEEVRRLAERSSEASGEIALLIARVSDRSDETLQSMGQGSRAVADGVTAVEGAAALLRGIIQSIDEMSERIQAIAQAAEGLAAGSEEMAAATEQQSATVQEISNSSQLMAVTADSLESSVRDIKTGDEENIDGSREG